MEMTIAASHEGLGTGTHLDRPTYGATFQAGFFDSRDTFQGWLAIKTLISGDITNIPEKSWRNTSCFPWGFSSSFYNFIHLVGLKRWSSSKHFICSCCFSKKKMKIYVNFQSGTFRFFFLRFPTHLEDSGFTASTQMEESHRESTEDLLCPKFGGFPPLVALNLHLPSREPSHIITYPSRGSWGEQSSTQKWDTGDILSIPLSHPNYQLRINYWYLRHILTYRVTILFGTWDICLAYPPRHSQIIPSI